MTEPTVQTRRRSPWGWLALATAALSAFGLVILLVGLAFDIEGASEGEEGRAIFDVAWIAYLLGGIATLVTGAVAFALGRGRGEPDTVRAGTIALAYFAIALVVFVIAAFVS